MKNLLSLSLVLFAAQISFSQPTQKAVLWSTDPGCGARIGLAKDETVKCTLISTGKGQVGSIAHNGMRLSIAFTEEDGYLMVAAGINNMSETVVGFDSDRWTAAHFRGREDLVENKKPMAVETSMPTRDIVRSMTSRSRYNSSLDVFMNDMRSNGRAAERIRGRSETRRRSGLVSRVNAPSPERRSPAVSPAVLKKLREMRQTALTAKYVRPGDTVKGLVYFRRVKKARLVIFTMEIGDVKYLFGMPRGETK